MSLFNTPEYIADKKFGGPKYAGLRLLERMNNSSQAKKKGVRYRTIPAFYSPGFGLYRQMMRNGLNEWLNQARMHMDNVFDAYKQVLRGETIDDKLVREAHGFFGLKVHKTEKGDYYGPFSEENLINATLNLINNYIDPNLGYITNSAEFIHKHEFESVLFRSSMGIEDLMRATQGLFHTLYESYISLNSVLKFVHDKISVFCSTNCAVSLFAQRRTQMNFILCGYIEHTSGGVCLSSAVSQGQHYVEVLRFANLISKSMPPNFNTICGNTDNFGINYILEEPDGRKPHEVPLHKVSGVSSFCTETQIRNLLDVVSFYEELCGCNVDLEFLFEPEQEIPTLLQIRRSPLKRAESVITDDEFESADYKANLVIKAGEFKGEAYMSPVVKGLTLNHAQIEKLLGFNRAHEKYAVIGGGSKISGDWYVSLGEYSFCIRPIKLLEDLCTNARVFINSDSFSNKGGHQHLRAAEGKFPDFYLSIPDFSVPDGTLIHAKSDGYRGIVNVIK